MKDKSPNGLFIADFYLKEGFSLVTDGCKKKITGFIEKPVLRKMYEETQIEWKIPDIITFNENKDLGFYYESPSFFINDVSCFLGLHPKSALNAEFMRLFIKFNVKQEFSSKFNISLKKLDGTVEYLISGIPKKSYETCFDMGNIIRRSQLLERRSELAPGDVFTIICRFKRELTDSTEISGKTMALKLISLDALSQNFKDLFDDKETCDVTLKVKDKEYKAHRSVLIARSSVFAATFKHDTLERQTGVITIPDCDPESFEVFLKFLYSGRLEDISSCCALNLYYTSDKYDIQELKKFCIKYLMQNVTEENICDIAVFSDKYDETALFSAVQDCFNKKVRKIFVTSEWECFLKEHNRLANKLLIEMSNVKFKD